MFRYILILSFMVTVFKSTPLSAQQNLNTVAVIDFQNTGGMGTSDVKSLTNRFRGLLVDSRSFIVVEREKMNEILKEQDFAMSDNCTTSECVVKVGELLGVQKMVAGSLGKVGQTYVIDIRLIDVSTGSILKSVHRDHKGEADGLLFVMEEIVSTLNFGEQNTSMAIQLSPPKPALSFYGEAAGVGGVYSVNADYRLGSNIALRLGFTQWSGLVLWDGEVTGVPIGINYLVGRRYAAEIGAFGFFYSTKGKLFFSDKSTTTKETNYGLNIGYRYQPEEGGFLFRATLYPTFGTGEDGKNFRLFVGASIGFTTAGRR